jgi:hypothetical protein
MTTRVILLADLNQCTKTADLSIATDISAGLILHANFILADLIWQTRIGRTPLCATTTGLMANLDLRPKTSGVTIYTDISTLFTTAIAVYTIPIIGTRLGLGPLITICIRIFLTV